ncbi:MAG: SIR2 family protein [Leuconostoc citreum]
MINWPPKLLKSLSRKNTIIFFGAGVAAEFGIPSWGGFVDKLVESVSFDDKLADDEINQYRSSERYLDTLEVIYRADEQQFHETMRAEFLADSFPDFENKTNQELLFDLGQPIYLTTNVDNSIEEARKNGSLKRSTEILSYTNTKSIRDKLLNTDLNKNPLVVSVHGQLSDPQNLIFTRSQYSNIFLGKNTFFFEKILPALFLTHTVLMVGYSLNDPDLQMVLEKLATNKPYSHNIYLLLNKSISKYAMTDFENRLDLQVVNISNSKHHENPSLELNYALQRLQEIVNKITDDPNQYTDNASISKLAAEVQQNLTKKNHESSDDDSRSCAVIESEEIIGIAEKVMNNQEGNTEP